MADILDHATVQQSSAPRTTARGAPVDIDTTRALCHGRAAAKWARDDGSSGNSLGRLDVPTSAIAACFRFLACCIRTCSALAVSVPGTAFRAIGVLSASRSVSAGPASFTLVATDVTAATADRGHVADRAAADPDGRAERGRAFRPRWASGRRSRRRQPLGDIA
jgi:hypothetical protein